MSLPHRHHRQPACVTRRAFLGTAVGAAAGVSGLSLSLPSVVPRVCAAPDFHLRAPEPHAKRGGVLRYGIHNAPSHFDLHQSGTVSTVSEINVRDAHTIEFKLHEARPQSFMLGAFASGWNVIVRKKTLEENNYNLRQVMDYPGTGPFRHKKRVDKEVWVMERNPDHWNEGLPYLDGIEFYHLTAFSSELGGALLAGKIDYARLLDPVSLQKVKATPGMSGTDFY